MEYDLTGETMAWVKPFRGLRPVPRWVAEVAAPPYDVIETDEARERVKGHPLSFLHVSRAEVDLGPEIDPHDPKVYEKGLENLNRFIRDGVLVQDPKPCFYLYKLRMGDREQTGLYACVSVEEYERGVIKKHENTRIDKEMDRVHHIDKLNAHTGPVFLMVHHKNEVQSLFLKAAEKAPVYRFVHEYGVEHTFWVVDDGEMIRMLTDAFASVGSLYIADGHHRAAAAGRVGRERREKNPKHTGNEEYNFFPAVIFPDSEMRILNYNRVVKNLNGLSTSEFLRKINASFEVIPVAGGKACQPETRGTFGMYLDGKWTLLKARENLGDADDPIACLDVSILQEFLLSPVLGIRDPRTDQRIRFVGGIRGPEELEKMVNEKGFAAAFSLYPTGIDQLMKVADAGKVMPPKSTWFEPKLRSGLAVHLLSQ
jgi:uncharacterized protein (DUF1015 family)